MSRRKWLGLFLVAIVLAVLVGGFLALRFSRLPHPDVRRVSEVSCGYGTLRIRQGSPASLSVKADPLLRPHLMARRTGNLLELGLADDSDPRVLLYSFGLMPKPPANAKVEWVLTVPDLDRLGVNDRSVVYLDGLQGDSLRVSASGKGRGYLRGLDLKNFYAEISYGDGCRIVTEGYAETQSVLSGGPGSYDGSKLQYRYSKPFDAGQ